MLNQVKRAIEPVLPLRAALEQWGEISHGLAEAPRSRKSQIETIKLQAQTS
jgi:hypothetical protein